MLLSIAESIAILPAIMSPILLDYVEIKSLGTAFAWLSIFGMIGTIFATSVVIKLQEYYSIDIIYDIMGGLTILTAFLVLLGLKEMPINKNKNFNGVQLKIGLT